MSNAADLNDDTNWLGGLYELAIEVGDRDDDRLAGTLRAAWREAGVDGCFSPTHGPADPGQLSLTLRGHEPTALTLEAITRHIRGTVVLPNGETCVCGACAIRFDRGDDWLTFYVPMGGLNRCFPDVGGYPFGDYEKAPTWRPSIDTWLADIGRRIYNTQKYQMAMVGFEPEATPRADLGEIPAKREWGYLVPADGTLAYHEPTY